MDNVTWLLSLIYLAKCITHICLMRVLLRFHISHRDVKYHLLLSHSNFVPHWSFIKITPVFFLCFEPILFTLYSWSSLCVIFFLNFCLIIISPYYFFFFFSTGVSTWQMTMSVWSKPCSLETVMWQRQMPPLFQLSIGQWLCLIVYCPQQNRGPLSCSCGLRSISDLNNNTQEAWLR